jgi:hypothetical protein
MDGCCFSQQLVTISLPGGHLQACAGQRKGFPMFRFWVAGAAFFSLAVLTNGAETFGSKSTSSSSTSTVTDHSFNSAIVTPTKNAKSSFSGATGLGTVVPLNQTWSAPAPRTLTFLSAGTPTTATHSMTSSDPVLWTDARRAVTSYLGSSSLPTSSASLSPSATYFAPPKTSLFATPQTMH